MSARVDAAVAASRMHDSRSTSGVAVAGGGAVRVSPPVRGPANGERTAPPPPFDASAPVPEAYDVFCEGCGYSLLGLAADRCPECGMPYDTLALPYARVPWLHRRRVGRWAAYWQTVRQVVFHPRAFATELCRPVRVSADDARRFRRISTHLAAVSATLFVVLLASALGGLRLSGLSEPARVLLQIGLAVVGWVSGVAFLRLASDVPVFIWKGLPSLPPSELAPLHHYASAPFALFPLVGGVILVLGIVIGTSTDPFGLALPLTVAAIALGAAWVLACWWTPVVLMRAATGCGWGRAALLALYLPVHWFLMALLTLMLTMIFLAGAGQVIKGFL
jgi:hypothetical protein